MKIKRRYDTIISHSKKLLTMWEKMGNCGVKWEEND
jgi:hypothetical protein